jgi:predicted ATPase
VWYTLRCVTRITVRNLGPIARGDVRLTPLTVFIGPNNTGKSFLCALIYAAHAVGRPRMPYSNHRLWLGGEDNASLIGEAEAAITEGLNTSRDPMKSALSSVDPSKLGFLTRVSRRVLEAYGQTVVAELERCLGGRMAELTRANDKGQPLVIGITNDLLNWSIEIRSERSGVNVVRVAKVPPLAHLVRLANSSLSETLQSLGLVSSSRRRVISEEFSQYLADKLFIDLTDRQFDGLSTRRHYLPAARSGIMQSHKALVSFLVGSAPLVGLERMAIPQLSGILTDFLRQLINMNPDRATRSSDLAAVARFLERDVLNGSIDLRSDSNAYPEIYYRSGTLDVPLVRLSSMVSELAPVVLYLRHVLRANDLLIVEEPEAHLHPQSQRAFAQALASTQKGGGVNVVITTHSDYLLTEINNLISADLVHRLADGGQVRGRPISRNRRAPNASRLRHEDVSAYLFKSAPLGTRLTRLNISATEGIPDEEFSRVAEAIYDETVNLQYQLLEAGDYEEGDAALHD